MDISVKKKVSNQLMLDKREPEDLLMLDKREPEDLPMLTERESEDLPMLTKREPSRVEADLDEIIHQWYIDRTNDDRHLYCF